jgi:hypothetical protein
MQVSACPSVKIMGTIPTMFSAPLRQTFPAALLPRFLHKPSATGLQPSPLVPYVLRWQIFSITWSQDQPMAFLRLEFPAHCLCHLCVIFLLLCAPSRCTWSGCPRTELKLLVVIFYLLPGHWMQCCHLPGRQASLDTQGYLPSCSGVKYVFAWPYPHTNPTVPGLSASCETLTYLPSV